MRFYRPTIRLFHKENLPKPPGPIPRFGHQNHFTLVTE